MHLVRMHLRSCLGTSPLRAQVPFFQITYYSLALFVSVSSSCFTLAVPQVYCVGYTPRAWDPRLLQSMLNGPLYFGLLGSSYVAWKRTALNKLIIIMMIVFCVRSVLLRYRRSLFKNFILPSCTFNIFPNGHSSWRSSIPKALFKQLLNLFKASSS